MASNNTKLPNSLEYDRNYSEYNRNYSEYNVHHKEDTFDYMATTGYTIVIYLECGIIWPLFSVQMTIEGFVLFMFHWSQYP